MITSTDLNNKVAATITLPLEKINGILKIRTANGLETVAYTVKNGKVIAQLYKAGELVVVPANVDLTDIANNQYNSFITKLAERGIVSGDNGEFKANAKTSRGQFAAMVARAMGLNEVENGDFTDISDQWYAGYVNALAELELVSGKDNGKFDANGTITRQQAFTILGKLLEAKGLEVDTNASTLANYKDASSVSDYAKPYVDLLIKIGAVNGDKGLLNPSQDITRGQMTKILAIVLTELEML